MQSVKPRILIVEDDDVVAEIQGALLSGMNYEVDRVASLNLAQKVFVEKFDLLLLDYHLPDGNGIEFLRQIGKISHGEKPDCIFVSAANDPEIISECLRAGANDFMRKPFDKAEFMLRVKNQLYVRQLRRITDHQQERLEGDLRKLGRFFSQEVVHGILDGSIATEAGGSLYKCSCMILDLRNSTKLAEIMGPSDFFKFLSELFADLTDLVFSNGGSVSKYTGDGFLVTFGLPDYEPTDTMRAVECALKIREHMKLFNQMHPGDPVSFGIGIATGEIFAGNIGNIHRLEYTLFGDPVNLASRLESLTKKANVDILIDGPTRMVLGKSLVAKKLQNTAIRGKTQEVSIYFPVHVVVQE